MGKIGCNLRDVSESERKRESDGGKEREREREREGGGERERDEGRDKWK